MSSDLGPMLVLRVAFDGREEHVQRFYAESEIDKAFEDARFLLLNLRHARAASVRIEYLNPTAGYSSNLKQEGVNGR